MKHLPEESIRFIRSHIAPVSFDENRFKALVCKLDDDRYEVRRDATEELAKAGRFAEQVLRDAIKNRPSPEAFRRLRLLLDAIEPNRPVPYADSLRAGRVLQVLELISTTDAKDVLSDLAGGAQGSWLTREATKTLERMQRATPQLRKQNQ
jgi:hypothetical protein